MNRIWIVPGILLVVVLFACTRKKENPNELFVSGRIDGDTVDISFKSAGKVTDILVREGDSVKSGQLLAKVSSPQDEAQKVQALANVVYARRRLDEAVAAAPARVDVAEAKLAAAQADLVRSQAERHQAAIDAERYPPLVLTGAVASQAADQEATRLKVADASTNASRKEVLAAEAELQQAKAQLQQISTAKATLKASQAELHRIEANVNDLTMERRLMARF